MFVRGYWLSSWAQQHNSVALKSQWPSDSAPKWKRKPFSVVQGVGRCVPLVLNTICWEFLPLPDGFAAIENLREVTAAAVLCSVQREGDDCGRLTRFFLGEPAFCRSDEGSFAVIRDGSVIRVDEDVVGNPSTSRAAETTRRCKLEWEQTDQRLVSAKLMIVHVTEKIGGAVVLEGGASFINPVRHAQGPAAFEQFVVELRTRWPRMLDTQEMVRTDLTVPMRAVLPVLKQWNQTFREAGCSIHLCMHQSGSKSDPRQKWWLTVVRRKSNALASGALCTAPNEWFPAWRQSSSVAGDIEQSTRPRLQLEEPPRDGSVFTVELFSSAGHCDASLKPSWTVRRPVKDERQLKRTPVSEDADNNSRLFVALVGLPAPPAAFQMIEQPICELQEMMREPSESCGDVDKLMSCVQWLSERTCHALGFSVHLCARDTYAVDRRRHERSVWLTFVDLQKRSVIRPNGSLKGSDTSPLYHVSGECFASIPLLLAMRGGRTGIDLASAKEVVRSDLEGLLEHAADIGASRGEFKLLPQYMALCIRALCEELEDVAGMLSSSWKDAKLQAEPIRATALRHGLAHILIKSLQAGCLDILLPAFDRGQQVEGDPHGEEACVSITVSTEAPPFPGTDKLGIRVLKHLFATFATDIRDETLVEELVRLPLCFLALAMRRKELLGSFIELVEAAADGIFGRYYSFGSDARKDMCKILRVDRRFMQAAVALETRECDTIIRRHFFWSPFGMKLFGGVEVDAEERAQLLKESLEDPESGHPVILKSFLELETKKRGSSANEVAASVQLGLRVLFDYLTAHKEGEGECYPFASEGYPSNGLARVFGGDPSYQTEVVKAVQVVLDACMLSDRREVFDTCLKVFGDHHQASTSLLQQVIATLHTPEGVASEGASRLYDALDVFFCVLRDEEQADTLGLSSSQPQPGLLRKVLSKQPGAFGAYLERSVQAAATRPAPAGSPRELLLGVPDTVAYALHALLSHLDEHCFPATALADIFVSEGVPTAQLLHPDLRDPDASSDADATPSQPAPGASIWRAVRWILVASLQHGDQAFLRTLEEWRRSTMVSAPLLAQFAVGHVFRAPEPPTWQRVTTQVGDSGLVAQALDRLCWSESGELAGLLAGLLELQPATFASYLEWKSREAKGGAVACCLDELFRHLADLGVPDRAPLEAVLDSGEDRIAVIEAVGSALDAMGQHYETVFEPSLVAWKGASRPAAVLVREAVWPIVARLRAKQGIDAREEMIVQTIAFLFVKTDGCVDAFAHMVPGVFEVHLRQGTEPRKRLNWVLLENAFHPRLEKLICDSDAFVTAPYFWNTEVMPLCTQARIDREYAQLIEVESSDGQIHLYGRLLALLLRLSSLRGGDVREIARRTKEVLDQFARNQEQQQFLLSIFSTLEQRSIERPDDFSSVDLTLLGAVAENGVQTLRSVGDVALAPSPTRTSGGTPSRRASRTPSGALEEATSPCRGSASVSSPPSRASATMSSPPSRGGSSRRSSKPANDGMKVAERCTQAMTTLLQTYIAEQPPSEWQQLFKEATNVAFMVKYMFREDLAIAKAKFIEAVNNKENFKKMQFAGEVQEMLSKLVSRTLDDYGEVGIYDPEKLAEIDFLTKPELLVELVSSSKDRWGERDNPHMRLMTDITVRWMQYMIDRKIPPLTPHHTQAFTVMMMARCFIENVPPEVAARIPNWDQINPHPDKGRGIKLNWSGGKNKFKPKAFIAQMATGEGKSIVIAMLAVFMVRLYGMRVHVLENNEGLLERDYRQNKPFFARFGLRCASDLADPDAHIFYCLKAAINKRFLRKMVEGKLDEELATTVLIVDEVDDLVVNERPNNHYVKMDSERTPDLRRCFEELSNVPPESIFNVRMPDGVDENVWQFALAVVDHVAKKVVKDKHYRVMIDDNGDKVARMLDSEGKLPKVPLTAPWLQWVAYKECDIEANSESRYACVCAPYIYNKYAGIFGLTGSVGGKEELKYLTKTYSAVKFDVPRFLDTCDGDARKEVTNHGIELVDSHKALVKRVVALSAEYYQRVPVLVIASSLDELTTLHQAIRDSGKLPAERVQRLSEFDADGRSLKAEWQQIIDDASKRVGLAGESSCRVTVTDRFGGRGHDFQVVDKEANANGGMLVIATSIPDEREWIQWRGRTARQDRPGQFHVVLDKTSRVFSTHAKLVEKVKKSRTEHAKIEALLEVADERIGDRLREFSGEQATGEKLNELTEIYYKTHPRGFEDAWPYPGHKQHDRILRQILLEHTDSKPDEVKRIASDALGIKLSS